MNVLIINPPLHPKSGEKFFPLGLCYIATVLESNRNHDISIFDIDAYGYSKQEVYTKIRSSIRKKNIQLILTGGIVTSYDYIKWLISSIRSIRKSIKIVIGGSLATTVPILCLEKLDADICIVGEAEVTVVDLLTNLEKDKELSKIKGIVFKRKDKIVKTEPRELIHDLDELPLPNWKLFSLDKYILTEGGSRQMQISIGRGCPYDCNFCYQIFGHKYRHRSIDSVIEEIVLLKNKYNINYFMLTDDLPMSNKIFLKRFCKELIKRNMNIKWSTLGRINLVDDSLLSLMKESGCQMISFGIESGSQKILDRMNKKMTLRQIEEGIKKVREYGLSIFCSFIIGYPGEDEATIFETLRFRKKLKLSGDFYFVQAIPGSKLYEFAKTKDYIKDEDAYLTKLSQEYIRESYMFNKPIINFSNLSTEELIALRKKVNIGLNSSFPILMFNVKEYLKRNNFNKRFLFDLAYYINAVITQSEVNSRYDYNVLLNP